MRQIISDLGHAIVIACFDYQIHLVLNPAQAGGGLIDGLQRPLAGRVRTLIYPCYSARGIVESGGKGEVGLCPVHSAEEIKANACSPFFIVIHSSRIG